MNPFFSVIVPVYNSSEYLCECLDSTLRQSFGDFELIVINDGSTDNSYQIIKEYENIDRRIRSYEHCNSGQLFTRMKGVEKSNGKYCIFVDSDDTIDKDMLYELHTYLKEEKYDVLFYDWKKTNMNNSSVLFETATVFTILSKETVEKKVITSSAINSMCLKVVRTTIAKKNNEYDKYKAIRYAEDFVQTLDLIDKSDSFAYLNKTLYFYRIHCDSITHQKLYSEFSLYPRVLEFGYMQKWGINTKSDIACANSFLINCAFDNLISFLPESEDEKKLYLKGVNVIQKELDEYGILTNYNPKKVNFFKICIVKWVYQYHWRIERVLLLLYKIIRRFKSITGR
ncbi:Glycosyltransferase involved in cell wall bisynthesis [Eubacterium aggregans]|uniref:Glycosyltransferase involved in cell wall bisynthesis n=1 Tax=Eubacterium aggregans TaxID=81409 RepID=A0A1H3Y9E4_9FIRM|nr:glycosyltransferase family 2 protein [Eubacterium aggregans]SEA08226.1 Glycosyltransferase involved in cell wall bisynthesis [Eubacterium aggregans]